MNKVFKYLGNWGDTVRLAVPEGATFIHFETQRESPAFWALVNDDNPLEMRRVCVVGTGRPIDHKVVKYIGTTTVDTESDALVFHAFEIME